MNIMLCPIYYIIYYDISCNNYSLFTPETSINVNRQHPNPIYTKLPVLPTQGNLYNNTCVGSTGKQGFLKYIIYYILYIIYYILYIIYYILYIIYCILYIIYYILLETPADRSGRPAGVARLGCTGWPRQPGWDSYIATWLSYIATWLPRPNRYLLLPLLGLTPICPH